MWWRFHYLLSVSALKTSRRRCGTKPALTLPATAGPARVVVVADEQRIDAVRSGAVAADHELLLVLELQLLPRVAPLSGRSGPTLSGNLT